ncbi:hypothetical protein THRCLA_20934 [Thraustotheca clavata]|uniref:Transmembrane protein n=1 Tax=Thraustotheca clavata TaxID=74557 RepID=A0A1W0A1V0_9STRA|nr:hypothetical protein THRCLA_20934 [Thraustotheca clavata]
MTMAPGVAYFFGPAFDVTSHLVSFEVNASEKTILSKMPFAQYYSKHARQMALAFGTQQINASDFSVMTKSLFFRFPLAYTSTWANDTATNSPYQVLVLMQLANFPPAFVIFKLIYRISMTISILYIMRRDYYCHFAHLKYNLQCHGMGNSSSVLFIVVGDPSSIVLLNPYISLAFYIDFLLSLDYMCRAIIRISQIDDKSVFILAALYLSRSLWFAYGALSITSFVLKKIRMIRFQPIDPSMLAVFVSLMSGPISYMQSRIVFFIEFYYILLNDVVNVPSDSIEVGVAGFLFMYMIIGVPVMYGLISPWLYNRQTIPTEIKHRILVGIATHSVRHLFNSKAVVLRGGSIYPLFASNQNLRRHLAMSQMGADCFVMYRQSDGATIRVRLTLINCIDMPIKQAKDPAAVGFVDPLSCSIYQGSRGSPWVQ